MGQKLYTHQRHAHHPRNINEIHTAAQLTLNGRIAVWVAEHVGSMTCAYLFAAIGVGSLVGIITDNTLLALLCGAFSSYFLQLVLLPVLAMGQNILGHHAQLQAEEQYKTTLHVFHDSEQVVNHLLAQDDVLVQMRETLLLVLDHLGIEAEATTDHKLPVVRIGGHKTQIDEDDLLISLTRATGIKPEVLAALPLETKLLLERQRPHASERMTAAQVAGEENLHGLG